MQSQLQTQSQLLSQFAADDSSSQSLFERNELILSENPITDFVTYEEKMAQTESPINLVHVDPAATLSPYLIAYGDGYEESVMALLDEMGAAVIEEFDLTSILRAELTYEQAQAIEAEENVLTVAPDRLVDSTAAIARENSGFSGYIAEEDTAISEDYLGKAFLHETLETAIAESAASGSVSEIFEYDGLSVAYDNVALAGSSFSDGSAQATAAYNTPSLTFTSVTSAAATFAAVFPESGAYGNYIEYYDPITEAHTVYAGSYYMPNGSYSITGLHPGSTYTVWLCWYTDAANSWLQRYNTYSVTIPYPAAQTLINNFGTYVSTSFETFDVPYFGGASYLSRWIGHLDNAYLKLKDLTGYTPYSGSKINVLSDRSLSSSYWATSGNPIKWAQRFVAKEAVSIKDNDDWSFGILHELGHDFDSYQWNWNSEFFANFKMCYLLEQLGGAKVKHHSQWFTGSSIQNFYYSVADDNYTKCINENYFHHDFLTYVFLRIKNSIGWQPFKDTFRYFLQLPSSQVPSTNADKFYLFIAKLGDYANVNIRSYFQSNEISIIQNYFGKAFPAYQDAQIVSDTIPTLMYAGRTYQVSITVKNTGLASWTSARSYKLGAVGGSDPFASASVAMTSSAHVDYLGTHAFQLTMIAPYTLNTYLTDWRTLFGSATWFGTTDSKNVLVREPEYNPEDNNYNNYIGAYTGLNYGLSSIDIQGAFGFIENSYGCGPSAGALLLWHLGERRYDYSDLLQRLAPPQQYSSPVDIAEVLITSPYMNSIFGTTVSEFQNGITTYLQVRSHYPQILYSYKGTGLGSGATTTNIQDVWNTIINGLILRNAPVALGIGSTISNGPSGSPDTNLPKMTYHWVVVTAYLECGPNAEFKFIKTKTWGQDKYASFTSLNLWRTALAAAYIDESYL
jgi:hypothetical protein